MHRNRERRGVVVGLIIMAVGIGMIALPPLIGMDGMNGGFALQFVGLLVVPTGLIILWTYHSRASVLDRIFAGEGILAHWTNSPERTRGGAAARLAESRAKNRSLFWITTILIIVIGVPVLVVPLWEDLTLWRDPASLVIVGGYLSLIPFLWLFAWGMPRLARRRAEQDGAEVYISKEGVFANGSLTTWKQPFSALRAVRFNQKRNPAVLEFDIRYLSALGIIHFETNRARVPVPEGQEQLAEEVVRFFAKRPKR